MTIGGLGRMVCELVTIARARFFEESGTRDCLDAEWSMA